MLPEIAVLNLPYLRNKYVHTMKVSVQLAKEKGSQLLCSGTKRLQGEMTKTLQVALKNLFCIKLTMTPNIKSCGWITADPKTKIGHCTQL